MVKQGAFGYIHGLKTLKLVTINVSCFAVPAVSLLFWFPF